MSKERIERMRLFPTSRNVINNCTHYTAKKTTLDINVEKYVGKKFRFNFNPYHYVVLDINGLDVVIDSDDPKERIYVVFKLNQPYIDFTMDAVTKKWIKTNINDFFSVEKSELYRLEEMPKMD